MNNIASIENIGGNIIINNSDNSDNIDCNYLVFWLGQGYMIKNHKVLWLRVMYNSYTTSAFKQILDRFAYSDLNRVCITCLNQPYTCDIRNAIFAHIYERKKINTLPKFAQSGASHAPRHHNTPIFNYVPTFAVQLCTSSAPVIIADDGSPLPRHCFSNLMIKRRIIRHL